MTALFRNVLDTSFSGAVVIAVVLLLRLVMFRVPRKYSCLLWLLVCLRLLCPVMVESGLSLQPDISQLGQRRENTANTPQEIGAIPAVPEDSEFSKQDAFAGPGNTGYISKEQAGEPQPAGLNWYEAAAWVWLTVACALALYSIVSYLHLKWRVREAVRLTDGVYECGGLDTAFILGYFRPVVYIPMSLSYENRRFILDHEWMHLRRLDHWFKLLMFAALAVHWFNPLAWAAYLLLCRDMEMACDERVVRGMGLEERKAYSTALLACSSGHRSIAACPVAFGEVSVKGRIVNVLNYRKPVFWLTILAAAAVIFVAVCFLTNPLEKIDPLTLDDWGVSMTAMDPTPTGVTMAIDIPEKLDGTVSIVMNAGWILQKSVNGKWEDVPMLPREEPAWTGFYENYLVFPDDEAEYVALDWTAIYGEMEPGEYRICKTMYLKQDALGYEKEFTAPFCIGAGYSGTLDGYEYFHAED